MKKYASDSVAVVLCGTKVDLLSDEDRMRVCARANTLAAKAGASHVQTSSKQGTGVRAAFEHIAREVRLAATRRGGRMAATQPSGLEALLCCWVASSCAPMACCMQMPWQQTAVEGATLRRLESPPQSVA